jgi:hypothetical protein
LVAALFARRRPNLGCREHGMNRLLKRSAVARGLPAFGAGSVLVSGLAGWATAIAPDEPHRISSSNPMVAAASVAPTGALDAAVSAAATSAAAMATQDEAQRTDVGLHGDGQSARNAEPAVEDAPATGEAAPDVEVRVGDHGTFERVVFEWPEPVAHDVVHRGDQVVIAFARPGRIDLAPLRKGFGRRLLAARVGGDPSGEVVLQVVPDAAVHAFSLEDDRIVVIDVSAGTSPQRLTRAAPEPPVIEAQFAQPVSTAEPPGTEAAAQVLAERTPAPPTGDAAPQVRVRLGDHGAFERVVFEWPEPIAHALVHRGDQVVVAFSRPGRIDLAALREGSGRRVVAAWSEGGDTTSRVVLRLVPDAKVRTFTLQDEHILAIDVSGETAPSGVDAERDAPGERHALEQRDAAIAQRDAVIADLLARVEQLERLAVLSSGDLDQVTAGGTGAGALPGEAPLPPLTAEATAQAPAPASSAAGPPAGSSAQEPAPASQAEGANGGNAPAKPGEVEVVEQEIDRALERTLVQTGVLLLPLGQAEVEPYFSYTRRENSAPVLAAIDGAPAGAEVDIRRDEFVNGQALRFGLPFDSQVEFDLPYRMVKQSTVTKVGFAEQDETDHFGHGMGDFSVGLAKTLVREDGNWWPDLIGRITWDADTGKTTSNDVALGGGFNELRGSLSAVKRQDPLAFIGGVSYETTFEKNNIKPGDALGFSIGTVLAASPGTSLRLALDQTFVDGSKVDGEGINGSDSVIGTATLGASVVLGRGVLLDVAADIGLTDDAPDYAARASLPIRFNLPIY